MWKFPKTTVTTVTVAAGTTTGVTAAEAVFQGVAAATGRREAAVSAGAILLGAAGRQGAARHHQSVRHAGAVISAGLIQAAEGHLQGRKGQEGANSN